MLLLGKGRQIDNGRLPFRSMNGTTICRPERVTRAFPENMSLGDEVLFRHELVRDIAETRALLLRDVSLLPNGFLVSGLRVLPGIVSQPRRGTGNLETMDKGDVASGNRQKNHNG